MDQTVRIIVIDDDENIRKVLGAILQDEGYDVESAGTGKEGIEKTNERFFNVALIDIRLPDMEGIKLLTEIKDTTPKMRKIIITGYPTLQNAVDALNNGASAYILKPFDVDRVLNTIRAELVKQREEKTYSQNKVAEFIETRVRELEIEKEIARKTP